MYGEQFIKGGTKYTLITSIGSYAILKRDVSFEPFLCVYNLHFWKEGNEYVWDQGHYFDTEEEALFYALVQEKPDVEVGIASWGGVKEYGIREITEEEE